MVEFEKFISPTLRLFILKSNSKFEILKLSSSEISIELSDNLFALIINLLFSLSYLKLKSCLGDLKVWTSSSINWVNLNIELPSIDINSNICNQTIENKLENFNDLEKNIDNIDKVNLINNETIKPNYLCPLCCEELNIKYFNTCEVCQFKICQKCFKLYLKYDYTNCPHCRSKLKLKIKIPKHEIRNNFSTIDNSNIDIFNIYQNRLENDDRLPMACVLIIAILKIV